MARTRPPAYKLHPLVRDLRDSRGVPLTEAARRLKITHGHLSNLEAGRRLASAAVVRAYADLLGVSWDRLINGDPEVAA